MSAQLVPLHFQGQDVRSSDDAAHVRWLCARDVGDCLGMNGRATVAAAVKRLHHDQRCQIEIGTPGGRQSMTFVTIGGAIKIALQSRKPAAESFVDWVSDDVMAAVLTTGRYEVEPLNDDAMILRSMQVLTSRVEAAEQRARQEALDRVHSWTSEASDPALDLTVKRISNRRHGQ